MSKDSELFIELWHSVVDNLAVSKRTDVAVGMMRIFQDFGMDKLIDIEDEGDDNLDAAYALVFHDDEEYYEDDDYNYFDDEE